MTDRAPNHARNTARSDRDGRLQLTYVELRHTEREMDAWWHGLTVDAKARLFEGDDVIRVEGTVE